MSVQETVIAVHSGGFHADDLFATSVILLYLKQAGLREEDMVIVRTREESILETAAYVLDVGGVYNAETNRFDHHQEGGAGTRENGIPYAAFGLAWKHFGETLAGSKEAQELIDTKLVQSIDALDNGVDILGEPPTPIEQRYLLQSAFRSFTPTWEETFSDDEGFFELLPWTTSILLREIAHAHAEIRARKAVDVLLEEREDPRILVLDKQYPHGKSIDAKREILFVVEPSSGGMSWSVRGVRESKQGFTLRQPLPETWAGKRDEELQKITGVEDALFVHNKRFLAVAQSKEGALKLAQKALEA